MPPSGSVRMHGYGRGTADGTTLWPHQQRSRSSPSLQRTRALSNGTNWGDNSAVPASPKSMVQLEVRLRRLIETSQRGAPIDKPDQQLLAQLRTLLTEFYIIAREPALRMKVLKFLTKILHVCVESEFIQAGLEIGYYFQRISTLATKNTSRIEELGMMSIGMATSSTQPAPRTTAASRRALSRSHPASRALGR